MEEKVIKNIISLLTSREREKRDRSGSVLTLSCGLGAVWRGRAFSLRRA